MRLPLLKLSLVFALFLTFSITVIAGKREEDARPTKKADVTKQQTAPATKSVPTDQDSRQPVTQQPETPTTPITPGTSDTRVGEQINWQVLASGGGLSTMGTLMLGSTVGQTVAGQSTMGDFILNSGFQQNFDGGPCCIPPMRGDVNYDGAALLDISDLLYLIDYMFQSGPAPACHDEADVNGDGAELLDISDLLYLIDYMFQSGPEPPPCP